MYTRRNVINLLLFPEEFDAEERIDLQIALYKLKERHRRMLLLFSEGYTLFEISKQESIKLPYRFFRSALRSAVGYMNGKGLHR